jgi:hypothetical protein
MPCQLPCSCLNGISDGCNDGFMGMNSPQHTICSTDPGTVAYMKSHPNSSRRVTGKGGGGTYRLLWQNLKHEDDHIYVSSQVKEGDLQQVACKHMP